MTGENTGKRVIKRNRKNMNLWEIKGNKKFLFRLSTDNAKYKTKTPPILLTVSVSRILRKIRTKFIMKILCPARFTHERIILHVKFFTREM